MLAKSIDARVRPQAAGLMEKSSLQGAARIYVSKETLISLTGTIEHGKHCLVTRLESSASESAPDPDSQQVLQREAVLWTLPEKNLSRNVVVMSTTFRESTGFKIGDLIRLTVAGATPDAQEVVVQDVTEKSETDSDSLAKYEKDLKYPISWEVLLSSVFNRADLVFPGGVVEAILNGKLRKSFKIISVNSQTNNLAKFSRTSTSIIIAQDDVYDTDAAPLAGGDLVVTGVPGLSTPVIAVNRFLAGFTKPFRHDYAPRSCGFVIHGGPGTGKTFFLKRIAETGWGRVHWIEPSDKIASIREKFKLAVSHQPSIVLIDNLHNMIKESRSNCDTVIETIAKELDALSAMSSGRKTLAQVVVIATCLDFVSDIPRELSGPGRFFENTPLRIPGPRERQEILESFNLPIKEEDKHDILARLAKITHAYSPLDLLAVATYARKNILETRIHEAGEGPEIDEFLTMEDLEQSKKINRPTAVRDVNLNPPTVLWQDVGGQDYVKKAINKMIKFTTNPEKFLRPPSKGLLLYGPPGCSKTLSAQAAATESGFNFFAVKGAELLNMYVGESERGIRDLFSRAYNASPSIIFFDEIDSIAGQRAGGAGGRGNNNINTVAALLTEMDGFEKLSNVLVIAATNRPDAMDPALMRPGRFDKVLYVGPPDEAAREAIFNVHLRGLPLASDVDIPELARRAEGHSGAEIKQICDEACEAVQERFDGDEANKLEVTMADLTTAISQTKRHITTQMLEGFKKWQAQFSMKV
ncbi:AAA family ATPase [Fusarium heterosporum]|uniref:AAA family ATPase n=1 Tax=Fusarium heterosporum TaxID=42747 RepID=A0A8H5TKB8_FUSHE|nr:AAA family ATPase [Fusarium heterosporum]